MEGLEPCLPMLLCSAVLRAMYGLTHISTRDPKDPTALHTTLDCFTKGQCGFPCCHSHGLQVGLAQAGNLIDTFYTLLEVGMTRFIRDLVFLFC